MNEKDEYYRGKDCIFKKESPEYLKKHSTKIIIYEKKSFQNEKFVIYTKKKRI